MLQKNQSVTLNITGISTEGSGVGRFEGIPVFVPMSAVGDRLLVRIVKVLSGYCFGIIEEVLEPSPCRTEARCGVYRRCGGCSLRHITYESELLAKEGWVRENIRRIGKSGCEVLPILPSPQTDGYRNKAVYPIGMVNGKVATGFYAKRSHDLIQSEDCALHPPFFAQILAAVRKFLEDFAVSVYDESTHAGIARSVFLRYGEATGEVMVCLIINASRLPREEAFVAAVREACPMVSTVLLNENRERTNVLLGKTCRTLYGPGVIRDRLLGLTFEISPLSFYQVNRRGAEVLYRTAGEFAALTGRETLLDLYCGAGTIGLTMAHAAGRLIGVEIVPEAVENARENAKRNGIGNARFFAADAAEAAERMRREGVRPDVVVLDPPRKGCESSLIACVAGMGPSRVVMVSCNSATAARDIAAFEKLGYRALRCQPVDMFPRTAHVESVILLTREQQLP